ncbi:MAG: 30S ribosomal protein S5 [Pirellulales bacterium]|nr:30S ribosomal protein S5 [Pirellulales bacterium]
MPPARPAWNSNSRSAAVVAKDNESNQGGLIDKVVKIKRCAAVVKGGRRFSFAAMVVVGDGRGRVGWGYGKANEVPPAVEKAVKDGSRSMSSVPMEGDTIPHTVKGQFGAAQVILVPAAPGTGVIAGASVRAVCEAAGIHNILTKSFGSTNPVNLVKATMDALSKLRSKQDIERLRGVTLS